MAGKHLLQGLIKWSTREPWSDRFERVLEGHVMPAGEEKGLEIDEIIETLGEDLFMSTVWACAFEDFLTSEFEDGANVVDEYLKRRGWKESASVRAYMAALRNSTMSLYEVSDIVRDKSFRARDLIRGGEPILISEGSATRYLKPWDHIAMRVVHFGSTTQMSGGALPFDHDTTDAFMEAFDGLRSLDAQEAQELAEAADIDIEDIAVAHSAPTKLLRAVCSMLTMYWLIDMIDRATGEKIPELRNSEGDQLLFCEARYPIAAGSTAEHIRAILVTRPEFRQASDMFWNWISIENPATKQQDEGKSLKIESTLDDGVLSLGGLELENNVLVLTVNSEQRWELGQALLAEVLGDRLGPPVLMTQTVEQFMASPRDRTPEPPDISREERRAIVHGYLDRHYRKLLDEPVPMLGGESPRGAAKTAGGRIKVVNWLKMAENATAKSADSDGDMASYSFAWLWEELGLSDLRR